MVERNKVHRLYKLEGLQVRIRVRRKKHISLRRGPSPTALAAGQYWAMDFVPDQLASGRKFRVLTIIDNWHRQYVALQADFSLDGSKCHRCAERGGARKIFNLCDNCRLQIGIYVQSARRVVLSPRREARLHPTRQTHRERDDRVV